MIPSLHLLLLLIGLTTAAPQNEDSRESKEELVSYQNKKHFLYPKIFPDQCDTGVANNTIGTCMEYKHCRKIGGTSTTRCAKGLGTCCLSQQTCGQTTSANNTYFVSPNFPDPYTTGGTCQLTVNRATNNICQVRIDFLFFNLAQPTVEDGVCSTDMMTVTGGNSNNVPVLCGRNTGQHIYVNVDPQGSPLKILVDADTTDNTPRIFDMLITQIPCNSPSLAPSGCLQYFTTISDNVQSFNFPVLPEFAFRNQVSRQLANTQYAVCIRPKAGFCSIAWSPDDSVAPFSFFLTGDSGSLDENLFGSIQAVTTGSSCTTDYVIVPGGAYVGPEAVDSMADRFCGPAFPSSVTSTFTPFELFVKTDDTEAVLDTGNFGFSLNFKQIAC